MRYKFITIEGNIGSGKTSLAKKLAEDFNGETVLESFADNPFLPKFYKDPSQYAFPLELFFLAERFQQLKSYRAQNLFFDFLVTDYMFVKSLLFADINLSKDEIGLFRKLFNIIHPNTPKPDITFYLHDTVSNLLLNIAKRGRNYEQYISADYLQKIQLAYFQFFKSQRNGKFIIINTSQIDFIDNESDYQNLVSLLNQDYSDGNHFINP